MKLKRILAIVSAALMLTSAALADGAMTKKEMQSIWKASFDRMNTKGTVNISNELPKANDLAYDEALAIAREAIFEKYATPEEELDAMGVYPTFYASHAGTSANWQFYFTPMRDGRIDRDHTPSGQGEYRVYLDSPSGEVTYCHWYIDDFWPYAQRTWDAGKLDVVYTHAKKSGFFTQSREEQARWLGLMEGAGFDVSVIRSGEALFEDTYFRLDLLFGDEHRAVDPASDPRIATAWKAIEDAYGLDGELMRQYAYIAFFSPLNTGTRDIYIAYNYNIEWGMIESGQLNYWQDLLFTYVNRLGIFLVRLDMESGEVIDIAHCDRDQIENAIWHEETLLGRPQWGAADLVEFDTAFRRRTEIMEQAVAENHSQEELRLISDELMREIGGDPELYNSRSEQESDIGLEAGLAIARQAAAKEAGMTEDAFNAMYTVEASYLPSKGAYEYWFATPPAETESVYRVLVDAASGEVLEAHLSKGNG